MEISFALTKNGGSMPIGLGGKSFPVVRLAGWLAGRRNSRYGVNLINHVTQFVVDFVDV